MNTRFCDPDADAGGDGTTNALTGVNCAYKSLSIWEAARQAVLAEVEECICESNGGAHTADTTALIIDGWTTTSAFYIYIHTSAAGRHAGVYNTGKYRLQLAADYDYIFTITEEFVRVEGLQVYNTGTPNSGCIVLNYASAGETRISHNIVKVISSEARNGIELAPAASSTIKIWNNVIYNFYAGIFFSFGNAGQVIAIYNNTVVDCSGKGIDVDDSVGDVSLYLKNNLVQGAVTNYFITAFTTRNYKTNLSEDATVPATSPDTGTASTAITFVDETGDNFGLTASLAGTNLSTDADGKINIATDIKGVTRTEWSIGAFEYVAAGGLSIPVAMMTYREKRS